MGIPVINMGDVIRKEVLRLGLEPMTPTPEWLQHNFANLRV